MGKTEKQKNLYKQYLSKIFFVEDSLGFEERNKTCY